MIKNTRKKLRTLSFEPSHGTVIRWPNSSIRPNAEILVQLDDRDEPDRYTRLDLTDDEAIRLSAWLAHHVGYKLVEK